MTQSMILTQPDWTRFLTPEGLAEKCGVPRHQFLQMILKELVHNAMKPAVTVFINDRNSLLLEFAKVVFERRKEVE